MIVITTGRNTTARMNGLVRDLSNVLPDTSRMRRGKSGREQLLQYLTAYGADRMIALHRWQGGPGRIELYRVSGRGMEKAPPAMTISDVRLRREYGIRGKFRVGGITHDGRDQDVRKFAESLADFLRIPILDDPASVRTSLHLRRANSALQLAVTSPPVEREVGPSLKITHLAWTDIG